MKYYLTTPIYYVNAAPHIGHAYTTIVADTIKRFKAHAGLRRRAHHRHRRARPEGGALRRARRQNAAGVHRRHLGRIPAPVGNARPADRPLPAHHQPAACPRGPGSVRALPQNGYIYKGSYTGQYCIFDNLYVNDAKPGDPCPDCGRPTETVTEENFFFKLSAFQDKLLKLYEREPDFIQPETRRNEVLSFVKQGLNDLSITRTTIKWGIPVRRRSAARLLRLVRRAHHLHERRRREWTAKTSGPPTCT